MTRKPLAFGVIGGVAFAILWFGIVFVNDRMQWDLPLGACRITILILGWPIFAFCDHENFLCATGGILLSAVLHVILGGVAGGYLGARVRRKRVAQ